MTPSSQGLGSPTIPVRFTHQLILYLRQANLDELALRGCLTLSGPNIELLHQVNRVLRDLLRKRWIVSSDLQFHNTRLPREAYPQHVPSQLPDDRLSGTVTVVTNHRRPDEGNEITHYYAGVARDPVLHLNEARQNRSGREQVCVERGAL